MIWPTFCIDNFFKNPDAIIDVAKKLKFHKTNGQFPGERTDYLHKVNNEFFLQTTKKIMACLYPNEVNNIKWTASQQFQKINPKKHPCKGFIHQDLDVEFTSIIYLSDTVSNTCIYRRLKEPIPDHTEIRKKGYTGLIDQNSKEFKKEVKRNNELFEKTIEFKSVKNRMIIFDGSADHGVESFGEKEDGDRLTLITFFETVSRLDNYPLKYHANECKKY